MKKPPTPIDSADHKRSSPYTARANEFRKRRRWKSYMMKPPEAIMRIACDDCVPSETRVLVAVELFAWGNLSDWAIDRTPKSSLEGLGSGPDDPSSARPMTQVRLGELIGMAPSTVNDAVKILKATGYLRTHKFMFPEDSVKSLESSKDLFKNPVHPDIHSPLFRRLKQLVIERDEDGKTIAELEKECKEYDAKKSAALQKLRPYNRKMWQIWRDVQRGKSPLGITKSLLESIDEDIVA